jgi:RNA ligase (TIGR02306 family)
MSQNITVDYKIKNIKEHEQLINSWEFVAITEKIYGTFVQFGYIPIKLKQTHLLHLGCYCVAGKGLRGENVAFDLSNKSNIHTRTVEDKRYGLGYKLPCIKGEYKEIIGDEPIYILGEIYGPGVREGFGYGVPNNDVGFRIFDIAFGERENIQYLNHGILTQISKTYELPMAPLLYVGPYTKDIVNKCTNGKERVSGKQLHSRAGCIVKPLKERYDPKAGRAILKSISEECSVKEYQIMENSWGM